MYAYQFHLYWLQLQVSLLLFLPMVGGTLKSAAVYPSVCLSHAASSTTVHFMAIVTAEHLIGNPML